MQLVICIASLQTSFHVFVIRDSQQLYKFKPSHRYLHAKILKMSLSLQMENPEPFLLGLHGKVVCVQLKWGWELRGILQSKDEYMNLLLANTQQVVNGESKGELGEVLVRCNNILYIREHTENN